MIKNIKLNTFFFKEYAQIAEKNTYSAYIPNGSKGIWCIADLDEKTNEKWQEKSEISQKIENSNVENEKIEKINLAKIGVHKIIEKYLENNEFSLENIKQMIQSSIDKVIFEKTKLYKFHKAEKDFDLKNFYSQIVIIIEKNNIIVGNMGKTEFILYRENRIVEKISGEQVKKIRLKKHDYLLAGSAGFWKVVNESEIEEIYVDRKSKLNVEQNLSEQIKASEKKLGKVIPFLSIFVEDIEMEKNYELLEKEINEKNQKQEKVVKYMFLAVIFVFMFVSVGKNIQKGNLKGERKEKVKNIMAEKIIEKANLMKTNLNKQSEVERNKVRQKNIEDEVEKPLENSNLVENEEIKNKKIEKNYAKNFEITQNIIKTKEKRAKKLNNSRIKKKVSKNKKYNRKNLNVDNRNFKKNYKVKSNGISQLEKEIEKNWEILGRDRNGNNFVKNREFKRENKNGFFIKGNNIEWEV